VIRLPFLPANVRFFSRLKAPTSASETRRVERWLATARVFLSISALVAIWIDPAQLGYSLWAYWFLGLYIAHGVVVMLLLRFRKESTPAFRAFVHAADILWPALVSLFATGQRSPFFLFFVFVLGAAAYRWGLRETFGTALATVVLLWIESFAVRAGLVTWLDRVFARRGLPLLGVNLPDLEPQRLFMLSVYLLVMGLLLGYLAEQQKQLRAERAVITRVLARARVEEGLTRALRDILSELIELYGAERALLASQETHSYRVFVGEVRRLPEGASDLRWLESSTLDRENYLFDSPAEVWLANCGNNEKSRILALDSRGARLRAAECKGTAQLAKLQSFESLIAVSFKFGKEWWGRIFLLNPVVGSDREEELRFLHELVRQVGPSVYNVYLLRRLRQRAGAVERARVARELHDGAVQSLIAMEMQVDVLRRQTEPQSPPVAADLGRIQSLLREEVLKLRELMQEMKSLDVDSASLTRYIGDTVERFQRETGIRAHFVSDVEEIQMPQRVCRELARIVQEGLVNVRKHSKARHAIVHLSQKNGAWRLTVEDDGQGFPFAGRFTQSELEAMGKGPLIIRERVRLIEGELTVESTPSRGSRLEISVPRQGTSPYGQ
jgi:signal transduction histidine kinase